MKGDNGCLVIASVDNVPRLVVISPGHREQREGGWAGMGCLVQYLVCVCVCSVPPTIALCADCSQTQL